MNILASSKKDGWNYKIIDTSDVEDIVDKINDYINEEDFKDMALVKIAIGNNTHKHARGYIFWKSKDDLNSCQLTCPPVAVKWKSKKKVVFTGYEDLAEATCTHLSELNQYQQYYANVQFADAANRDMIMVVWYPEESTQMLSQ